MDEEILVYYYYMDFERYDGSSYSENDRERNISSSLLFRNMMKIVGARV